MSILLSITFLTLFYFFYPTMINRVSIVSKGITGLFVKLIYFIDTPALNCFPSMHCTLCFLTIFYILDLKKYKIKYKILIVIWSLLIIISTLFVKQHLIYDVIGALPVSVVAYLLTNKTNMIKKLFKKRIK